MLDANGVTRALYGIAGSTTLGDPIASGVLSSACSKRLCLAKTDAAIISSGESIDAPPGPALFALDHDAAFVYFPQTKQLARWHDGRLDPVDQNVAGEVLSIRESEGGVEFAVRRDDGTAIVRADNGVIDSLPDATGAVMLLDRGRVLFSTVDAVMLRRADGSQIRFEIAGAEAFLALGEGYVQVRAGSSTYAIRLEAGQEKMFLLPEAPQ